MEFLHLSVVPRLTTMARDGPDAFRCLELHLVSLMEDQDPTLGISSTGFLDFEYRPGSEGKKL